MNKLSVIIITKNEAANIERCLASVQWADEIIVVDSGSTDNTLELCKAYTQNIFSMDWPGYGPQKNRALAKATHQWVLSLDADEEVSAALKHKIQHLLQSEPPVHAYAIKRPVVFWQRIIRHACGAEQTIRLFKRTAAQFSDAQVHETVLIDGKVGKLDEPIYHYSFASIGSMVAKMNQYTDLVAEQRAASGKRSSLFKAITHALWMFLRIYILKAGFLDGKPGFILAVGFAEGAYYRYVKLLYLNREQA